MNETQLLAIAQSWRTDADDTRREGIEDVAVSCAFADALEACAARLEKIAHKKDAE